MSSFFEKLEHAQKAQLEQATFVDGLSSNDQIFNFPHFFDELSCFYHQVHLQKALRIDDHPDFLSPGCDFHEFEGTARQPASDLTTDPETGPSCLWGQTMDGAEQSGGPAALHQQVAYHFHAAVCIFKQYQIAQQQLLLLSEVLNVQHRAFVLCTKDGRVVYSNKIAKKTLSSTPFHLNSQCITFKKKSLNETFIEHLKQACGVPGERGFWIMKAAGGSPYTLCIRALPRSVMLPGTNEPLCFITISPCTEVQTHCPIHHMLDLSSKEVAVVNSLLKGKALPAIAAELYVSHNTVRSHIRRIFHKTGTRSQIELINYVRQVIDQVSE